MTSSELLVDGFGRIAGIVHDVLSDATAAELTFRVDAEANTIAWLVWHLTRVQDHYVSDESGEPQVWEQWRDRFGLPFSPRSTGYGHSADDVAAVDVPVDLLLGYFDATSEKTVQFVEELTDADLATVVDTNWDPPVTLAVRLISMLSDDLQHAGQAGFVLGVARRS